MAAGGDVAGKPAEQPAPEHVHSFGKQLPDAKMEGGFLRLAEGSSFLGDPDLGAELYVRPCYEELLKAAREMSAAQQRGLVVCGSSGVGKSFFGLYLLQQLVAEGKTVVWEGEGEGQGASGRRFLFDGKERVLKGLQAADDFDDHLGRKDVWYLVDGSTPQDVMAFTVLLTAPHPDRYQAFLRRRRVTLRYMPVWSEPELERLATTLFPDTPEWRDLYSKWGGIPRSVLVKAADPYWQAQLERALSSYSLSDLVQLAMHPDAGDDPGLHLLHVSVDPGAPHAMHWGFASPHVARVMLARPDRWSRQQVQGFLAGSAGRPHQALLREQLFEPYALRAIAGGGGFDMRALEGLHPGEMSGYEHSWYVEPGEFRECATPADFGPPETRRAGGSSGARRKDALGELLVLQSRSWPSPGAAMRPGLIFRCTTLPHHPQTEEDVLAIMAGLGTSFGSGQVFLVFVVPPDVFSAFGVQPYVDADGKPVSQRAAGMDNVKQCVLCVRAD